MERLVGLNVDVVVETTHVTRTQSFVLTGDETVSDLLEQVRKWVEENTAT